MKKIYKSIFSINYDKFTDKIGQLFRLLNDEDFVEFDIRIGDHRHEFEIYVEEDNTLCVNHSITIDWYVKSEKRMYFDCCFDFTFDHRKKIIQWDEYIDDRIGDFPIRDHVLFKKKKNLIYPDLFLKQVDLAMVKLV